MPQFTPDQILALSSMAIQPPQPGSAPGMETLGQGAPPAPSRGDLADRYERSSDFLVQFIDRELGGDPDRIDLARRYLAHGHTALAIVNGQTDGADASFSAVRTGLEVIVETDGSRPSYLVREGGIVATSAPSNLWTDRLDDVLHREGVRAAIAATGRIDLDHPLYPYAGTGWLAGADVMLTNRHVAQLFVDFGAEPGPRLRSDLHPRLDFGHEFNGVATRHARPIVELLFAGAHAIQGIGLDHSRLDLAAFRLGPPAGGGQGPQPLDLGTGARLTALAREVFLVGYPFRPDARALGTVSETDRILSLLFDKLWGFKRLSPGEIRHSAQGPRGLDHDATTLGGSSGSAVVGLGAPFAATGIHYGGDWGGQRSNFGHVLEAVLDEPGCPGLPCTTLRALHDTGFIALRGF